MSSFALLQAALFASLGVCMEIVFTAVCLFKTEHDPRLMGYSYVWMLPVYACVPFFLDLLQPLLRKQSLTLRLGIYTVFIYGGEYASGFLLRRFLGVCPWETHYHGSPFSVDDLIRLDYAPAWAL